MAIRRDQNPVDLDIASSERWNVDIPVRSLPQMGVLGQVHVGPRDS